jgi:XTP/dITP diphosphohydrolase
MARRLTSGSVVIATHNAGKLREMRSLLMPFSIVGLGGSELGLAEPEETAITFEANASLKACAAAAAAQLPALADDSGLCVAALDDAPGVYSARWAGPERDFALAMERVEAGLRERDAFDPQQRRAHFICVLSLAWPDGHVESFAGRVDGTLVWPPRGTIGFGYDPIFRPDGHRRTFGEMTSEEKHGRAFGDAALSHRARAFEGLAAACLPVPLDRELPALSV